MRFGQRMDIMFRWLPSGPEVSWQEQIGIKGWANCGDSDLKSFKQFWEQRTGVIVEETGRIALDVDFFDPTKNSQQPYRLQYLAKFIRPVSEDQAIHHLIEEELEKAVNMSGYLFFGDEGRKVKPTTFPEPQRRFNPGTFDLRNMS